MKRVAIIGGGISGLSSAQMLKNRFKVTVFEKESLPGGLIRCERVSGALFHLCGGHVFNTKIDSVRSWFWNHFDKDVEFLKADRNSVVFFDDGSFIPYPIENHMYFFNEQIQRSFIQDLIKMGKEGIISPSNFEEFLLHRFGQTLYELYFQPYNEKIWRRPLNSVPMEWLEGKFPMPTIEDMIYNNMNHLEEKTFVHSSFFYEREGGSQFIANRLAENLDIRYNCSVTSLMYENGAWRINGESYDYILFCGNIKQFPTLFGGIIPDYFVEKIGKLEYHGTTSVFCKIDSNPYSWVYQPSKDHMSHRIICTGNFSPTNNARGFNTGTIEFTDLISYEEIQKQLQMMPFNPVYITHHFSEYTYPIQDQNTRQWIQSLKGLMMDKDVFFCGRFADWEYYNMDVAINAAMKTTELICARDGMA